MKTAKTDEAGGQNPLDDRTTYRFSILASRQTRCLTEMYLQKFGLSLSQWKIVPILGYFGAMSSKEVGMRTSLEPEKVTRAVDQLTAKKIIIRRPDSRDRRRVVLTLSAKGRKVFEESEFIRAKIEDAFLGVLASSERATLKRLLHKLEERAAVMFSGKKSWLKIVDGQNDVGVVSARKEKRRARN